MSCAPDLPSPTPGPRTIRPAARLGSATGRRTSWLLAAARVGGRAIQSVLAGPGRRVLSRPGHSNVGDVYVEYARPVAPLEATIGRIELGLLAGVAGGALLAGGAGARIARRPEP
jgi:hypothetical protein